MSDDDQELAGELLTVEVEGDEPPAEKPKRLRGLAEWGIVIGIALLVALGIRHFVFQPFWIPSGSMEDTLVYGDRVLVNKLSYKLHDVNRGDVVVFEHPESWELDDEVKDLIKRVIGLPGDTVTIEPVPGNQLCDTASNVLINGQRLVETYTDGQCTDPAGPVVDPDQDGSFVVPDDVVFVMGDNRGGSQDSRVHGYVPESDIVGRAFVIIWPIGNWSWL